MTDDLDAAAPALGAVSTGARRGRTRSGARRGHPKRRPPRPPRTPGACAGCGAAGPGIPSGCVPRCSACSRRPRCCTSSDLDRSGWANAFYSAAVQAGTKSWKAFFFGSSDAANFITVDKPPASLWVMELSARIFGVNAWSILVPQALEGVAASACST